MAGGSATPTTDVLEDLVRTALTQVMDPEIRRPITELGMVRSVEVTGGAGGDAGSTNGDSAPRGGARVVVGVDLTVAGCPMKSTLVKDVTAAAQTVPGVGEVSVDLGVMSAEQRTALRTMLRGGVGEPEIPFAKPDSLTKVYAIASGKGGVGKSSVTANLAVALAADGLSVGVVDADIYGFSIPRMLGVDRQPTRVDNMLLPPVAHGVKVVSIGMFVPQGQPVIWRGPMLHRALQQFLADVYWGDLDVLLLDLPPGTGDIAISVAQLLPTSEILVVTTPQVAAAEVAERAGSIATQTQQGVVGVVENMSWLEQPDGSRLELFGAGGGAKVAENLTAATGGPVELLGQVPLDMSLREAGDAGTPVTLSDPDSPAAVALRGVARSLAARSRGLAGRRLGLSPV
ncbi:Mrp/NBP35 family ATP-binding protein [Oerskovia sp. KBS0722]|uniref:Mrp/NBP35 family ATP-binding protein n=1 Tax=Oerskovia sp. KBS0722 TaxID=1179673 RepID=UPI00110F2908|nr:Mrp/NBP35 family ATP-binding protein [Oerskovia sp. KBS0722]QDW62729.1 Mrp/NBP35 family ATP-binding protein [Oerskovia sp. KBS0722]